MILSAQTIRSLCRDAMYVNPDCTKMISPFCERTVQNGKSFGLSAAGYDVRIDIQEGNVMPVFPGDFMLASTLERFVMPSDVMGVVHDKSSWARKGLTVQNTVIEPGWSGYLTLELTNHSLKDIVLYPNDPIAQIVFHRLDSPTIQPYSGKYQNQKRGPQEAIEE